MYPYGIMNETEQLRRSKAYGRMLANEWRMANGSTSTRGEAPCPGALSRAVARMSRTARNFLAAIARRLVQARTEPRSTTIPARRAERGC
ncbi:MAG: hypothetical protein ACXWNR_01605 [Candidatus Limnocylindrales bacterium]